MASILIPEENELEGKLILQTTSVCPVCLARIPANRVAYGEDVYLEKTCPDHGFTRTILWRGSPAYASWGREKIPNHPANPFTEVDQGCPYDCGLCSAHRQTPCCVLLEVTQRCDLGCPVCFASAEIDKGVDTDLATIRSWYDRMLEAGGPFNVQLSGGEPCLRDDLPDIITMGKEIGFTYFQVNTNGLRIAKDLVYLQRLKDAGLQVVYLQFDGTKDEIYQQLRGRSLFAEKINAIENCRKVGLGVVLVPTIMPGCNDENIGAIVQFALDHYPIVRSIHFQPVCYFGRYFHQPENSDRITIPEILQALENQTNGRVHTADFQPKGSENSYCSFHATYVIMPDDSLRPIRKDPQPDCGCKQPEDARQGVKQSREFVAKNWPYHPEPEKQGSCCSSSMGEWDVLLDRARTHLFSISGMAFQDAWNLDVKLLRDCCINIASEDGRLIPFCAYNLTGSDGHSLYRPALK